MKSKILKTVSILQAFVLIIGMCIFSVPMTADAASLGVTTSASYQSSVYYQRACTAYSSYTDPRTRFVQVALSQAGYKGGTSSGDWAGNGGGGQFTEYGRFMGADNDNWCASFVSWCAAAAGIPTNVIPRYIGAGDWRKWPGNGTVTFLWSNNYTTYNDYQPQVGDLCLYMPYCTTCGGHYNAQSPTSHVVIVAAVSNTKNADGSWSFTTIERGAKNTVSSNNVTTKMKRGTGYTCTCGNEPTGNAYVVQGFYRPNWSLLGTTITAGDVYGTLKWTIDSNGVLNITGTGEIPNYYCPWRDNLDYRDKIRTIVIGEGITRIGNYTFTNITTATSATIPSTVKKIGTQAFEGCTGIKSIYLYDGVEAIGNSAFFGCSSLSTINIPDSITAIGGSAFQNCTSLTSTTLPAGADLGDLIYTDCTSLTDITIEDGVTTIGDWMFYNSAITEVTIPASVTKVGLNAFGQCSNLTDVYLSVTEDEWENNVTVGEEAFPQGVTFHFKESYLDFKVIENESNTVTLSWNRDEYSYAYDVNIYDEFGFLLESHSVDAEDAVDGVVTTTFTLRGGNYKAEIVCLNTAGIIITEEVSFTVEATDADNYSIDALNGSVSEGRFYAEVEVVNVTDREEADTVIIAVYKNDEMIDYVYMKTDLPKGQTVTFGGMLEGVEGATLKAFVWDSIQGMKALSNVVEK